MKQTTKTKKLVPAVLSIVAKCSDRCCASLQTKDGQVVFDYDGYVPELMPGEPYGDYIEIDIELATGKILNWKKPSQAKIKRFIKTGH
jgi:hypothetical protein